MGRSPDFRLLPVLTALALAGCGGSTPSPADPTDDIPVEVPAKGKATTFDVATWNLEWLGDPGNGPTDEETQRRRIRDVIAGADLDLWAVQEVVDQATFDSLVAELPGYSGFLADDPSVDGGAASYSDFGDREQKVGLVFKNSVVQVLAARVVLQERDHEFAGRPPLEVRVRVTLGGQSRDAVVIVLHAKAGADEDAWARREAGARALRAHLDATWRDAFVWILGDFNDDVDTSITPGRPTPYAGFVASGGAWSFATAALSAAGVTSTVGFADVIDHHLVSDEVAATLEAGSVEAYRVDAFIGGYGQSTSDHFPVLARYLPN